MNLVSLGSLINLLLDNGQHVPFVVFDPRDLMFQRLYFAAQMFETLLKLILLSGYLADDKCSWL